MICERYENPPVIFYANLVLQKLFSFYESRRTMTEKSKKRKKKKQPKKQKMTKTETTTLPKKCPIAVVQQVLTEMDQSFKPNNSDDTAIIHIAYRRI